MTEEIKQRWHKIADHYGLEQLGICAEECAELIQALNKYKRFHSGQPPTKGTVNTAYGDVVEELADVLITTEQVKHLLGITESEIEGTMQYKLERTEKMIRGDGAS